LANCFAVSRLDAQLLADQGRIGGVDAGQPVTGGVQRAIDRHPRAPRRIGIRICQE
jgi:hypothetical protein